MSNTKEILDIASKQNESIILVGEELQNFLKAINLDTGRPNIFDYSITPDKLTFYPYIESEQRKSQGENSNKSKRYNALFHGFGDSESGVRTTKVYSKKDEF